MDDHGDFDSVSWRNESGRDTNQPVSTEPAHETTLPTRISNGKRRLSSQHQHHEAQAGQLAEPVDLGGIGDGILECTVGSPSKENDGTKDAYVSYLITTTVGLPCLTVLVKSSVNVDCLLTDRLQIVSEIRIHYPKTIHRFCLPEADSVSRISSMRNTSIAREEQYGLCEG
jgi:hypothetical protein